MPSPGRHTVYDWKWVWAAMVLLVPGAVLLGVAVVRAGVGDTVLVDLSALAFGWGGLLEGFGGMSLVMLLQRLAAGATAVGAPLGAGVWGPLAAGGLAWAAGWGLLAWAIKRDEGAAALASEAKGAKLYPRLADYRDFYWRTLGAYGGGILGAELTVILVHTLLAGGAADGERSRFFVPLLVALLGVLVVVALLVGYVAFRGGGERRRSRSALGIGGVLTLVVIILRLGRLLFSALGHGPSEGSQGFSPVLAFSIALVLGFAVAFAGGVLGAWRAKRLATPELTIAIIYFGLPIPLLLTVMTRVPQLSLALAYRLREVTYVASLLGRPELGYWLVFAGLVLVLFFGITSGFVATSSGRLDLRAGFELFVAARHVHVFRPGLLVGAFAVLIFGIIPPLLIYAILVAAQAAVERTRIRALGLKDPLAASEAVNESKLREQTPTAMMTALAVGGVGVGVMALIIVLSVMSGFEIDLQSKMLGTNAHAIIMKYSPANDMPEYKDVLEKIKPVKGIIGATPFILNEVMITSDGNMSGTMIKGIDPKTVGKVTDLPKYMVEGGSLEALDDPQLIGRGRLAPKGGLFFDPGPEDLDSAKLARDVGAVEDEMIVQPKAGEQEVVLPGVVIGRELAAALKVGVGDRVNIVSPLGGELGPQGPMPKSRPFRVAGIFYSGMYEFDSKFTYIKLEEAQSFFNVKGATGIELKVDDVDDARRIARAVYDRLEGYPYRTKDWGEMNRNLFSALRLEKLVMAIILSIIVIVASGLIVATVIMLVLEKRKEISVLKALGVPDGGIVKIFLAEGLQIGVAGGLLGLLAGLAWCLFIERVGIKLDPEVYYIPALPVKIEPLQTAISVVIAVLVSFLASIYPALKASRVEPVDGLKSE